MPIIKDIYENNVKEIKRLTEERRYAQLDSAIEVGLCPIRHSYRGRFPYRKETQSAFAAFPYYIWGRKGRPRCHAGRALLGVSCAACATPPHSCLPPQEEAEAKKQRPVIPREPI